MRLKIIRIIVAFLFLALAVGLVHLQVIRGQHYFQLSTNNRIRAVSLESIRGRILDRSGIILADSQVSFDVLIIPQEIKNEADLFIFLSQTLDISKERLWDSFQRKTVARFVPVVVAQDISRDQAVVLKENTFRFPGLVIQSGSKRVYPFKDQGSHILGYVGQTSPAKKERFKEYGFEIPEITGYSGIEEYYDSFLKGQRGGLQVEVNHRGEQVRLLGMKAPVRGQDVVLTIDSRIQKIAADLLADQSGCIVVLDFETGEVLGMVSSPAFDPNVFSRLQDTKKRGALLSDSRSPMLNRAIGGQYPPGSIFKIPVAIAALNSQKATVSMTFFCGGSYTLGRRQFRCTHAHGVQNFIQAISHSCNVYFYNLGLLLGPQVIFDHARLFGLGGLTNIDLPHEKQGLIPDPENYYSRAKRPWGQGDTLNISIGQGDILATPLQLVHMMATIARDGEEIFPRLLKTIGGTGQEEHFKRRLDIQKSYLESVKSGMKGAVEDFAGTARVLYIKGLPVFGKTGTAQSSGEQKSHAWFVGFCPESKTKIAFVVFLEHGGSSYHACLLAKQMLLAMQKEKIL